MAVLGGAGELARRLRTSEEAGLTGDRADLDLRRTVFGSNIIPPSPSPSFLRVRSFWSRKDDL
jgi:hypothetical protein